ncbi:hypothetical protein LCGC14_2250590 [marine sediment metagenome]|uniref:Disease resistance R13L4/SHOC-2-like LRR domain-containing protein n=1 Tax=marine sediment metagenome TaxID=412755 RepID=A0A0F9D317_9ZZZZ
MDAMQMINMNDYYERKRKQKMITKPMHYVYVYLDIGDIPFYVGKGRRLRMYSHVKDVKRGQIPHKNLKLFNKINKIPESIGKLESLEVFKLMSNEIDSIPESIEFLKKLETLNLAANKLKSLPIESISKLTSLRNLSISYNPLNPGEHFKLKKKLREKKGVLH